MTKLRVLIFLLTIIVVGSVATVVSLYARGYRFNSKDGKITSNGLLVVKSDPDGAQVYINGELKTATNATIPLNPATYDVSVKKEGYISWNKRLVVDKEIVTEVTANLFRSAPSLSPITFSGASNPSPSPDLTKIAYIVPPQDDKSVNDEKAGLWIIETINLPLGFSREPRRITDGNLVDSTWVWSPDGREILLTSKNGVYLLNTGDFTAQNQRVNIKSQKELTLKKWDEEQQVKTASKLKKLPVELQSILEVKAKNITFSPDEDMVLYTASGSATIADNLIKQLPGASTQKQERKIEDGKSYVYDIKEDRNFLVDDSGAVIVGEENYQENAKTISWFPTSRHLVITNENEVTIMDYDGTNKRSVYSGSYLTPHAYPTLSSDRLIILTNLGASNMTPNLYSLSIK